MLLLPIRIALCIFNDFAFRLLPTSPPPPRHYYSLCDVPDRCISLNQSKHITFWWSQLPFVELIDIYTKRKNRKKKWSNDGTHSTHLVINVAKAWDYRFIYQVHFNVKQHFTRIAFTHLVQHHLYARMRSKLKSKLKEYLDCKWQAILCNTRTEHERKWLGNDSFAVHKTHPLSYFVHSCMQLWCSTLSSTIALIKRTRQMES